MKNIFINLKRFDVGRRFGGVCPIDDPAAWIEFVIDRSMELGLGANEDLAIVYLLPEGLVSPAIRRLAKNLPSRQKAIAIGCQGVHWDDVKPGKNFGAFTSLQPAAAMVNLGCTWAILGHSEERQAKFQFLESYDPSISTEPNRSARALSTVSQIIRKEIRCAVGAGINVLVCIGETQKEHGDGTPTQVMERIEKILYQQLLDTLTGVSIPEERKLVIGYEPIWAIGPGKTPPGKEYITFVSSFIKQKVKELCDYDVSVVYGGGLKEENAAMLSTISSVDGGLVALTRFTDPIGFYVEDLNAIISKYLYNREVTK